MISVKKLEKLRDRILAHSAFKSLKNEDEDSKKLDSLARDLTQAIKGD